MHPLCISRSPALHTQPPPHPLPLRSGPGCSSVGVAAFQQVGPFVLESMAGPAGARNVTDLKLTRNIGSWSQFANMLFIDTPAPTGFSTGAGSGSWGAPAWHGCSVVDACARGGCQPFAPSPRLTRSPPPRRRRCVLLCRPQATPTRRPTTWQRCGPSSTSFPPCVAARSSWRDRATPVRATLGSPVMHRSLRSLAAPHHCSRLAGAQATPCRSWRRKSGGATTGRRRRATGYSCGACWWATPGLSRSWTTEVRGRPLLLSAAAAACLLLLLLLLAGMPQAHVAAHAAASAPCRAAPCLRPPLLLQPPLRSGTTTGSYRAPAMPTCWPAAT